MTDNTDLINEIVTEFEEVQKEFQKKAQTSLKKAFKEFFNENPRIKQIYWTQYTPYFNDGDECIFGVNDMYANVGEEDYSPEHSAFDIEEMEGTISSWSETEGYEQECKNFHAFTSAIGRIPDDIFQQIFGDHCQVIADRKGFEVEEYSHD